MNSTHGKNKRIVADSMGEMEVDADALYGAQTQRAIDNFPVSGQVMPEDFIRALVLIKSIAAKTNAELNCLDKNISDAIVSASSSLLEDSKLMSHFPLDVFQTGSGTSSNMNANEVIANLASEIAGQEVNPNDHVNFGQSSNDVIPTTIHVSAAMSSKRKLIPALEALRDEIIEKADSVKRYSKTGRTHLMDAMPIRMDQSLLSWADQIDAGISGVDLSLIHISEPTRHA